MKPLAALFVPLVLLAGGTSGADEPRWTLSDDRKVVTIAADARPEAAELRPVGVERGMALTIVQAAEGRFALHANWPLMAGTDYRLYLESGGKERVLSVSVPAVAAPPAAAARLSPEMPVLPANILRLHLFFDTPMARGQVADHVRLIDARGREIPHAFLNLGVELWSADQRRLTLMLDPGRLKRGVGPNLALGAPLEPGNRYAVEALAGMRDARNRPLARGLRHWFVAGVAERTAISPDEWRIDAVSGELRVRFGRAMDEPSVIRTLRLRGRGTSSATAVPRLAEDGSALWPLATVPEGSSLELLVGPGLEDAAGNTICGAFEVETGHAETCCEPVVLSIAGIP